MRYLVKAKVKQGKERPYWEEYFDLLQIKNTHDRRRCRDLNGTAPWACCDCDFFKPVWLRLVRVVLLEFNSVISNSVAKTLSG